MRKSNWESFLQIFETTTKRNSACLTSLKFIELNICQPYKWWTILKDTTTTSRRPYSNFPPPKKREETPKKTYDTRVQPNECLLQQCDYTTSACFLDHVHNTIQLGHVKHTNLGSAWPWPRVGRHCLWDFGPSDCEKNNQSDGPKKWCHIFFGHHGPYLLMSVPN